VPGRGLEAATNGRLGGRPVPLRPALRPEPAGVGRLKGAADRAWRTLELALAGETVVTVADRADDRAFREQVRLFLLAAQCDGRPRPIGSSCRGAWGAPRGRPACSTATPTRRKLAARLGDLTRFGEPTALLASQWALADELRRT